MSPWGFFFESSLRPAAYSLALIIRGSGVFLLLCLWTITSHAQELLDMPKPRRQQGILTGMPLYG